MRHKITKKNTGTAGNPGCWVFIVDYHGYSWLVDTNPRTALLAAQLLAHYPERCLAVGLSEFIIIFEIEMATYLNIGCTHIVAFQDLKIIYVYIYVYIYIYIYVYI